MSIFGGLVSASSRFQYHVSDLFFFFFKWQAEYGQIMVKKCCYIYKRRKVEVQVCSSVHACDLIIYEYKMEVGLSGVKNASKKCSCNTKKNMGNN